MALLEKRNRKNYYTREDDTTIVKMWNEGRSINDIAREVKRSINSVSYRIYRVLAKVDSFEKIKYKN